MKKFIFIGGLVFSVFWAQNGYAQLDLDELMAEAESQETETKAQSDKTAEADAEKADEKAAADAEQNSEISDEELFGSAEDEADTDAKDATAENAPQPEAEAEAKETPEDSEDSDELETKSQITEDEDSAQAELAVDENADAEEDKAAVAEDDDYNIFADDEVEDLFDEEALREAEENAAQNPEPQAKDDFMDDYFEDLEVQKQKDATAYKAQKDALRLISDKPNILKLKDDQRKLIRSGNQKSREIKEQLKDKVEAPSIERISKPNAQNPAESQPQTAGEDNAENASQSAPENANTASEAPFGLRWDSSKEETEGMGFTAKPAELENYQGVYVVQNPQQPQKLFEQVVAIYGAQDHLQAIYAQSHAMSDTPQAEKVLKIYHQYYEALEKKYGNAQEHFVPNKEPKADKEADNASADEKEAKNMPYKMPKAADNGIGNDNFLNELKEDKASLFATFSDDKIKVTLSVLVNEDGQSYITLDYENTLVVQKEQNAAFDALLNDL